MPFSWKLLLFIHESLPSSRIKTMCSSSFNFETYRKKAPSRPYHVYSHFTQKESAGKPNSNRLLHYFLMKFCLPAVYSLMQFSCPIRAAYEIFPSTIPFVLDMNLEQRIVLRLDRVLYKLHVSFLRTPASFLSVTRNTRTNKVCPSSLTTLSLWHHVIKVKFFCG